MSQINDMSLKSILRWAAASRCSSSALVVAIYYANIILTDIGVPSIATIAISLFKLVATPLAHSYCNSTSMHVSIATASSIHISIAIFSSFNDEDAITVSETETALDAHHSVTLYHCLIVHKKQ